MDNRQTPKEIIKRGITPASVIIAAFTLLLWGCPQYNVYRERKAGQASLARAQYSKGVQVAEAKAKMESAVYNAQADTIRAHGIARSNAIIGESLKDNESYLKWLWIDQLKEAAVSGNLIYVPTEGNMPIMEAGRQVLRDERKDSSKVTHKKQ